MKYRRLYFAISLILITVGIYSLARFGLNLAIDFTGGSTLQLKTQPIDNPKLLGLVQDQATVYSSAVNEDESLTLELPPLNQTQAEELKNKLAPEFDQLEQVSFVSVGPTIGQELIRKTLTAVALATAVILFFVARAFKSFKFGICAILAMFHDTFILIGSFSLLGHFFGAKVDLLFVTAVLTILSFSVHDTIVVYDRIRELKRKNPNLTISSIADRAVSETIVRSLNNSLTIIFMLLALVILGGETIRWFAVALLIGTIVGTYSSTFTATPLLVVIDELLFKRKK